MSEFITDMDARQAACDRAELVEETAEPGSTQAKAAAAVLYAYRFDGIMTEEEVASLDAETMTTATQIKNAIARSISHNEIVHITIDGDSGDALETIREVYDGDTDYVMLDHEGVDTLDIWGFSEETSENEQDWRLAIRFAD